jgi:hypothetical protein
MSCAVVTQCRRVPISITRPTSAVRPQPSGGRSEVGGAAADDESPTRTRAPNLTPLPTPRPARAPNRCGSRPFSPRRARHSRGAEPPRGALRPPASSAPALSPSAPQTSAPADSAAAYRAALKWSAQNAKCSAPSRSDAMWAAQSLSSLPRASAPLPRGRESLANRGSPPRKTFSSPKSPDPLAPAAALAPLPA